MTFPTGIRSRRKAGNIIIIKLKSKVNAGTIFQTIREDDTLIEHKTIDTSNFHTIKVYFN